MVTEPCDFHFDQVVAGFFELPTSNARRILPLGLEPLERCHGRSVLAVLAFDFVGGAVGPFREVVFAVLVPPFIEPGAPVPHSAMYPFLVGTSTKAAREHGRRHYLLPHHPRNVEVSFESRRDGVWATVSEQSRVLRIGVSTPEWVPTAVMRRQYQVLSVAEGRLHVAQVSIAGRHAEHEEESGELILQPHDFTELLDLDGVGRRPFREQRVTEGTERYWPVRTRS